MKEGKKKKKITHRETVLVPVDSEKGLLKKKKKKKKKVGSITKSH